MKNFLLIMVISVAAVSCNSNNSADTTTPVTNDTSITVATDNTSNPVDTSMEGNMSSGTMGNDLNTLKKDTTSAQKIANKKVPKARVTIVLPKVNSKMEMDKEGYYSNAEVLPAYPGGQRALENFFINNIEYPQQAADNTTEGAVDISFLVDESGKISSPKLISKKVGDGIDEEALRVFNKMPSWEPGKIKGKNVKTRFTLPIRFQLEQ